MKGSSSASEYFELPKYFYFSEMGIYSGSRTDRDFNYKVVPVKPKEGEKCLKAFWWSGVKCIDKSEDVVERDFPFSEEGHREMLSWLEEVFLSRKEVPFPYQAKRQLAEKVGNDE
ncbi:MAG: hypothetical protein ACI4JJ_03775 [Huintestinicola sp.]